MTTSFLVLVILRVLFFAGLGAGVLLWLRLTEEPPPSPELLSALERLKRRVDSDRTFVAQMVRHLETQFRREKERLVMKSRTEQVQSDLEEASKKAFLSLNPAERVLVRRRFTLAGNWSALHLCDRYELEERALAPSSKDPGDSCSG